MQRMTRYNACFLLLVSLYSNAQIGINTNPPHESAILDMSNTKHGLLAPRVALISSNDTTTIDAPQQGLLIYNTATSNDIVPGYYFWSLNRWEPLSGLDTTVTKNVSTSINASSLGYNPSGSASASPESFIINDLTATKKVCASFTDIDKGALEHSYCGYSLSKGITWEDAFNLSKIFKGYIVTITSNEEWNFLKQFIMTVDEAKSNIWIGYNKNQEPGNPAEYKWVTGEKSKINWSNSSTLNTFYANNEPNTANNCIKINATSISPDRTWQSQDCSSNEAFNYLIIEYPNR